MAAGNTKNELTLNLSLNRHPCVWVAIIVVSEMNERLSPKNEPPTIMAVIIARSVPVSCANPTAIGVSAAMVPTLVPMLSEMKHAARNIPAKIIDGGRKLNARFTVASILPIDLAEWAKAPASTNIQIISIICSVAAPRLKLFIRCINGRSRNNIMA